MPVHEFSQSVIEKLGYYVYLLIDPQTKQVFYIGKGMGNRVFQHAKAEIDDVNSNEKLARIKQILKEGLDVEYFIIRHGMDAKTAFAVEAALIDFIEISNLTNQVHGFGSDDYGRMTVDEIIERYDAHEADIREEKVILIKINRQYQRGMADDELYDKTRGDWVIGSRRNEAKYAFAVAKGIVREVYKIEGWERIRVDDPLKKIRSRWRFMGKVDIDMSDRYKGSSTVRYRGSQNPIRYINFDQSHLDRTEES